MKYKIYKAECSLMSNKIITYRSTVPKRLVVILVGDRLRVDLNVAVVGLLHTHETSATLAKWRRHVVYEKISALALR